MAAHRYYLNFEYIRMRVHKYDKGEQLFGAPQGHVNRLNLHCFKIPAYHYSLDYSNWRDDKYTRSYSLLKYSTRDFTAYYNRVFGMLQSIKMYCSGFYHQNLDCFVRDLAVFKPKCGIKSQFILTELMK